jgi:hypothetical protein
MKATKITCRIDVNGRDVTHFPELWNVSDREITFKGHQHHKRDLNRDDEIDLIYDLFDDMMLAGKMDAVDMLLRHWRLDDDIDSILAILTITLPAKTKLPSRIALLEYAIEKFGKEVCGGL